MKEDPERLQDWWQKKAKSIKIPPVQQAEKDPAPPATAQTSKGLNTHPVPAAGTEPTALQKNGAATAPPNVLPDPGASSHPGGSSTGATGGAPGQTGPGTGGGSPVATGSVAAGAGPGGGLLNATLFRYPFYLKNMENKISGQWSPPPALLDQGLVAAIVQFKVDRRGAIESIQIEKSSGNSQFDQAALRAVYNSNPLPPFPDGLTEDFLNVHFSFTVSRGS